MRKPKLQEDKERVEKQSATTLAELYPKSRHRLAHLKAHDVNPEELL